MLLRRSMIGDDSSLLKRFTDTRRLSINFLSLFHTFDLDAFESLHEFRIIHPNFIEKNVYILNYSESLQKRYKYGFSKIVHQILQKFTATYIYG